MVIWRIVNQLPVPKHRKYKDRILSFPFEVLTHPYSFYNKMTDGASGSTILSPDSRHTSGLLDKSIAVLRGHQSPIVAVALDTSLDICVSCSSEGLVLIHTVQTGEFRHSLYISTDICGRGRSVRALDIKHIPEHVGDMPSASSFMRRKHEEDRKTLSKHPDIRTNPNDLTSHSASNEFSLGLGGVERGGSALANAREEKEKEKEKSGSLEFKSDGNLLKRGNFHNNSSIYEDEEWGVSDSVSEEENELYRRGWGARTVVDMVRIASDGTIVFLSKLGNMIFKCDINGAHWNSLKVTDNIMAMEVDHTGKLLLTGGQCGEAVVRYLHKLSFFHFIFIILFIICFLFFYDSLSREVFKCQPVGDSITIAKFEEKGSNRVWIGSENGCLHMFALPKLEDVTALIDVDQL